MVIQLCRLAHQEWVTERSNSRSEHPVYPADILGESISALKRNRERGESAGERQWKWEGGSEGEREWSNTLTRCPSSYFLLQLCEGEWAAGNRGQPHSLVVTAGPRTTWPRDRFLLCRAPQEGWAARVLPRRGSQSIQRGHRECERTKRRLSTARFRAVSASLWEGELTVECVGAGVDF